MNIIKKTIKKIITIQLITFLAIIFFTKLNTVNAFTNENKVISNSINNNTKKIDTFSDFKSNYIILPTISVSDIVYGETLSLSVNNLVGDPTVHYYFDYSATGAFLIEDTPTDVGTYYVRAHIDETDLYEEYTTASEVFTISRYEVGSSEIVLENVSETLVYNGSPLTFSSLVVKVDGKELVVGTDYTVSYTNNTFVSSSANLIVTLINNYQGNKTFTFSILKGTYTTTVSLANFEYGQVGIPSVSVREEDANVTYYYDDSLSGEFISTTQPTSIGVHYVKAKLSTTSNYQEIVTYAIAFEIIKRTLSPSDIVVDVHGETLVYNGLPRTFTTVTIYDGEITLTGSDYTITYNNNTDASNLSNMVITLKGNYQGNKTYIFSITPKSLESENVVITPSTETFTYDGLPKEFSSVNVVYAGLGSQYTINYSNNVNASVNGASLVVNFTGNYSGSKVINFTINKATYSSTLIIPSTFVFGTTVTPYVSQVASGAEVTYLYGVGHDNYNLSGFPSATGTYYAKAVISQTDNYNSATTEEVVFTISKKQVTSGNIVVNVGGELLYYNGGNPVTYSSLSVSVGSVTLVKDVDYQISYLNNINCGVASYTITLQGNYQGSKTTSFNVRQRNVVDPIITGDSEELIYDGVDEKTFTNLVVKDDLGNLLVLSTDYLLEYDNNFNATTQANYSITFIGNYTGYYTKTFTVLKKNLVSPTVDGTSVVFTYDGQDKVFSSLTVKDVLVTLEENTDYILTYSNNKNAGTASLLISFSGNYSGSKTIEYTINRKTLTVPDINVTHSNEVFSADGSSKEYSQVVVRYNTLLLQNNIDYSVSYNNNINAGTATLVITLIGNYQGSKTENFTINSGTYSSSVVVSDIYYSEQLSISVSNNPASSEVTYYYSTTYDGTYYTDFDITNARTYFVYAVIASSNNFQEKVTEKVSFNVLPKPLSSNDILITTTPEELYYTGTNIEFSTLTVKYGSKTLVLNTDYVYSYSSNLNATDSALLKITLKGNYSGSKNYTFVINKQIYTSQVILDDLFVNSPIYPSVTTIKGSATVEYVFSTTLNGSYSSDVPSAAGKYYVKAIISETTNYAGLTTNPKEFNIKPNQLSPAQITIVTSSETFIYTGDSLEFDSVVVKYGTYVFSTSEYDLVYTNNVNSGVATVKVQLKGSYSGEKTITFNISKAETTGVTVSLESYQLSSVGQPSLVGYLGDGAVVYKYYTDDAGLFEATTITTVGTYYVKAIISEGTNYLSFTTPLKSFVVSKGTLNVNVVQNDYEYGESTDPTLSLNPDSQDAVVYYYSSNQIDYSTVKPINVGSYYVYAIIDESANYNEYTTQAVQFNITRKVYVPVVTISNYTYGNVASVPGVSTLYESPDSYYRYSTSKNGVYNLETVSQAGTYYIKIFVSETQNYASTSSEGTEFKINPKELTEEDITLNLTGSTSFTYNSNAHTLTIDTVKFGAITLVLDTDYTISYSDNINASSDAKLKISFINNYSGEYLHKFSILPKNLGSSFNVDYDDSTSLVYTGDAKTLTSIVVRDETTYLVVTKDYTINYENNINASTNGASLIITLKGNYLGSKTINYSISKATINATLSQQSYDYENVKAPSVSGAPITITPTYVYCNAVDGLYIATVPTSVGTWYIKAVFSETTNYNSFTTSPVSFQISRSSYSIEVVLEDFLFKQSNTPSITPSAKEGTVTYKYYSDYLLTNQLSTQPTNVGTYYIKAFIAQTEHYFETESAPLEFNILAINLTDSGIIITSGETFTYNTSYQTYSSIVVKDAEEVVLVSGVSYTLSYSNNKDAGTTAYYTIAFTGNYTGSITNYFTILEKELTNPTIQTSSDDFTFTGGPIEYSSVTILDSTVTLVVDVDYTITYINNVNAGIDTATLKIEFIGNYTGTAERHFSITRDDTFTSQVQISDFVYGTSSGITVSVLPFGATLTYYFDILVDGEFTSTEMPTNVGSYYVYASIGESANYPSFVTSKVSFSITRAQLNATVVLNNFEYLKVGVPQVIGNLGSGSVTYRYSTSSDSDFDSTSMPTDIGEYYVKAYISITDNYAAYITPATHFEITKARFIPTVVLSNYVFGSSQNPVVSNNLSGGEESFKYSTSLNGSYSTTLPTDVGDYYIKAVVSEYGNYFAAESVGVKFSITPLGLNSDLVDLDLSSETFTYNGSPKVYSTIDVVLALNSLVLNTDYTISYSNNINAGEATLTVTFKGNYSGNVVHHYEISKASFESTIVRTDHEGGDVGNFDISNNPGNGTITYYYTSNPAGSYSSNTKPNLPGDYVVYAQIQETSNYLSTSTDEFEFDFEKETYTVTVTTSNWVFGSLPSTPIVVGAQGTGDINFYYRSSTENSWHEYNPSSSYPTDAGSYFLRVVVESDESNSTAQSEASQFSITPKNLTAETVIQTLSEETFVYDTSAKTYSSVDLEYNLINLISGTDYTISYSNNINAGEATLTITFRGNYSGTKIINFNISKATLSNSTTYVDFPNFTYEEENTPVVVGNLGSGVVTYYYKNLDEDESEEPIYNAGIHYVYAVISESSNYNEFTTEELAYEVFKASYEVNVSIEGWIFGQTPNSPSSTTTPKDSGSLHFEYSTSSTEGFTTTGVSHAGIYYVIAVIDETDNYLPLQSSPLLFEIQPKQLTNATLEGTSNSLVYTGSSIVFSSLVVKDQTTTLVVGVDYVVNYSNNVNATTTAKLVIEFINDYSGVKEITFTINPKDLTSETVTINKNNPVFTYDNTDKSFTISSVVFQSKTLIANTDYEISYQNNRNAGVNTASLIVTFKNNYSGSQVINFTINKATYSSNTILDDVMYGGAIEPSVSLNPSSSTPIYYYSDSITGPFTSTTPLASVGVHYVRATIPSDSNYLEVIASVDSYTVLYIAYESELELSSLSYIYLETLGIGVTNNPASVLPNNIVYYFSTNETSDFTNSRPVNIGVYYVYAFIPAKGYYASCETPVVSFTIIPMEVDESSIIASATETFVYDGSNKEFSSFPIVVSSVTLIKNTDYTLTYSSNRNAGVNTASVKIALKGNYSGEKTIYFSIARGTFTANVVIDEAIEFGTTLNPTVSQNLGSGQVSYYYDIYPNGQLESTAQPTITGVFYVRAIIVQTQNYNSVVTESVQFELVRGTINPLISFSGYQYQNTSSNPTVTNNPGNGEVSFIYYSDFSGLNVISRPTELGTYYVQAAVSQTTYFYGGVTPIIEFKVKEKELSTSDLTIQTSDDEFTYEVSQTHEFGSVIVKDKTDSDHVLVLGTDYTISYDNNINAGNNASLIITLIGNYKGSATHQFTILRGTYVTSVTQEDYIYGNPSTPVVSYNPESGNVVYTYSISKTGQFSSTVPTNVGSYFVKATISQTSNYISLSVISETSFSINRATLNLELSQASYTFGSSQNPTLVGNLGDGVVSYTYSTSKTGTFVSNIPTNVGEYYVKAHVSETENYLEGYVTSEQFSILKLTLTGLTIDFQSFTYGSSGAPSLPGLVSNVTVNYYYSTSVSGPFNSTILPNQVGHYYVKAIIIETTNHSGYESSVIDFEILKATLYISADQKGSQAGSPIDTNLTYTYSSGLVNSDNFQEVRSSFTGSLYTTANSEVPDSYPILGNFTHPNYIVIVIENTNYKVVGEVPTFEIPTGLTAQFGDTLSSITLPANFAFKDLGSTIVGNVGTRTFALVYSPGGYYEKVDCEVSITVTPKSVVSETIIIVTSSETLRYQGTSVTFNTVTVTVSGITLTTDDYNLNYSNNNGAGIGTLVVTLKRNYVGNNQITFTIEKGVFLANVILPNYANDSVVSPQVSQNLGNGTVTYYYSDSLTGEFKNISQPLTVGTFYVYAVISETANYESVQTAVISFSVSGPELSLITVTHQPNKLIYVVGETFNPAGLVVTATYTNGQTKVLENGTYTITVISPLTLSVNHVSISYTEGSVVKNTEIQIWVNNATLVLLVATQLPNKVFYIEQEELKVEGLVVKAYYNDKSSRVVTGYNVDAVEHLTISHKSIPVTYSEGGVNLTTNFNIVVIKNELLFISVTHQPTKLVYQVGEKFNPAGMIITAYFSNHSQVVVTNYVISKTTNLSKADDRIIISFGEGSENKGVIVYIYVYENLLISTNNINEVLYIPDTKYYDKERGEL